MSLGCFARNLWRKSLIKYGLWPEILRIYRTTELRIYYTGAPTQKIRVIRFPTLKGSAHGGSDKIKAALSWWWKSAAVFVNIAKSYWCWLRNKSLTVFTGLKVPRGTSTKIVFQLLMAPFQRPGSSSAWSGFPSLDFCEMNPVVGSTKSGSLKGLSW